MVRRWLANLGVRLGWREAAVVVVVCAVFAAGYGIGRLERDPGEGILFIRADNTPFKVPPDERGGMEIPHQDKLVYGRFGEADEPVTERLLPAGEEPLEITAAAVSSDSGSDSGDVPAAPESDAVAVLSSGKYVIQLAAVRGPEDARAFFSALRLKYPLLLSDLTEDIERVEVEGQGVLYRVRAGYFADGESAKAACAALEVGGQDCLVRDR